MSTSVIYRSARGYELVMRALYGRHYGDRLRAVAEWIPQGASVLELCCGPGALYDRQRRGRVGTYIGLDINERFVKRLRRRGVDARAINVADGYEPLPSADVALIQASLYHFLPNAERIVDRMLAAARERVIVSEPIRNLASSELPLIGMLGRRGADPGVGGHAQRFTAQTLDALFEPYRERLISRRLIPGGREQVFVLDASR